MVGEEGQERLLDASVCIVGAGGLGCPVSLYLAAAGVGNIRIVDCDIVNRSNLNRQVLYGEDDIGKSKAEVAAERIGSLNPDIMVEPVEVSLSGDTVFNVADGVDILVDALDNYPARYILNRIALERNIPLVHAAVAGYFGQMLTVLPGCSACLSCAIPHPPETTVPPPVMGVTAGLLGCMQAGETLRILLGDEPLARDALMVWDGKAGTWERICISRDPECAGCGSVTKNG
jgi:adenylyltransferase/sulfurtransferase